MRREGSKKEKAGKQGWYLEKEGRGRVWGEGRGGACATRGGCVKRAGRELLDGPRDQLAAFIYMHPNLIL
jgi:hypothetical protein